MLDFLGVLFQSLAPLWEMSVTAAYAAAVVIVLRLLLKKRAPRQVVCLLWLVVFARLLIPVSLESPLSIVPNAFPGYEQPYPPVGGPSAPSAGGQDAGSSVQYPPAAGAGGTASFPVTHGNPTTYPVKDPVLSVPEGTAPSSPRPDAPAPFPWQALLAGVWLTGALAMGFCGLFSYLRLRRRLFDAIRARDGAWEHPAVDSPFILGILRPRIYLPIGLIGRPRKFILCHERAHLKRLDHIVKPVCWTALALHWFNPAVWAAYILMSRDIEAACDEAVIRRLGSDVKADYSTTLLALATGRHSPAPCPLAFDEGDAKGRIQNVLRYRRPALWVIVVSAVMAVMAAVCLLTDPVAAKEPQEPDSTPSSSPHLSAPPAPDGLLEPWALEVLNGEREFHADYDPSRTFNIHQLRSLYYGDDQLPKATVELGRLAILDLDRDGVNELVIWPSGEHDDPTEVGYYTGYLILRRQGEDVYSYTPGYRAFSDLKIDGTFYWSNSAFNSGIGLARFDGNEFAVDEITWNNIGAAGQEAYFVDRQAVVREAFEGAIQEQDMKPEPVWYGFEDGVLTLSPAAQFDGGPTVYNLSDSKVAVQYQGSQQTLELPFLLSNQPRIYWRSISMTTRHDSSPPHLILIDTTEIGGGNFYDYMAVYAYTDEGRWELFSTLDTTQPEPARSLPSLQVTHSNDHAVHLTAGNQFYGMIPIDGVDPYDPSVELFAGGITNNEYTIDTNVYGQLRLRSTGHIRCRRQGDGPDYDGYGRIVGDYSYETYFAFHDDGSVEYYLPDYVYPACDGLELLSCDHNIPVYVYGTQSLIQDGGGTIQYKVTRLYWGSSVLELEEPLQFTGYLGFDCLDIDGDQNYEVLLYSMLGVRPDQSAPPVYVFERPGLDITCSSYDVQALVDSFCRNTVVGLGQDGGLTVTYMLARGDMDSENYDRQFAVGHALLPGDFFDSCPELRGSDPLTVRPCGLYPCSIEHYGVEHYGGRLAVSIQFALSDGSVSSGHIGSGVVFLRYDGTGFLETGAKIDIEPYLAAPA